jgi:hypothetical protein
VRGRRWKLRKGEGMRKRRRGRKGEREGDKSLVVKVE